MCSKNSKEANVAGTKRGVWGGDVREITGSPDRGVDPATESIIGLGVYPAGGSELGC